MYTTTITFVASRSDQTIYNGYRKITPVVGHSCSAVMHTAEVVNVYYGCPGLPLWVVCKQNPTPLVLCIIAVYHQFTKLGYYCHTPGQGRRQCSWTFRWPPCLLSSSQPVHSREERASRDDGHTTDPPTLEGGWPACSVCVCVVLLQYSVANTPQNAVQMYETWRSMRICCRTTITHVCLGRFSTNWALGP